MAKLPACWGFFAAALLLGCRDGNLAGGTGTGNPPQADVTLSFKANSGAPVFSKTAGSLLRNPDSSFAVPDSAGATLTLSAIEVRVGRIEIGLPAGLTCADIRGLACANGEAAVSGPYAMDLMTGASKPSVNFIRLPQGIYTSVELEFLDSSGKAPDSTGVVSPQANIAISGRTASGKAFRMELDLRDGLDFEDTTGFRITAAALNTITLKLDVDGWFAGSGFSSCVDGSPTDASGTVLLEGDAFCGGMGLTIRRNIEASGEVENEEAE